MVTLVSHCWLSHLFFLLYFGGIAAAQSSQCVKGNVGANCTFYEDFCEWSSETWEVSRWGGARFRTDRFNHGVLQSPRICSTQWAVHCLSFDYQFLSKPNVMLTVFLDTEDGGNVSVWQLKDDIPDPWTATASIQTTSDFRILFQVEKPQHYKPGVGSYVNVADIAYQETECSVSPADAAFGRPVTSTSKPPIVDTSKPPAISTSRPFIGRPVVISPNTKKPSTRRSRPTRPSVSKRPSPSPSPPSSSAADPGDPRTQGICDMTSTAVVIPSVVAAVAVTALVVVVVVFVWWRRAVLSRLERAQRGRMEMASVASTHQSTRARDADTNDENDSYDDIAPSHYDVPGELSTNPYSSLKVTGHHDVIATSATPRCVIL
ncbi:uncharacterized protein LOC143301392 isoform X2 [Babylonia areolata]|uniref:uncharacterized protein LOC143301392 isoform X2 n=1 Tax=Babylonia areolata TaxID=304850 RepID=UPI003FD06BB6